MAIILYFRSEFLLFVIFFIGDQVVSKKLNSAIVLFSIMVLLCVPCGIRNYMTLGKIVPFTINLGINLYRGNNSQEIGNWGTDQTLEKIKKRKHQPIEIAINEEYKQETMNILSKNPFIELKNILKKFIYFVTYNPNDSRTDSIFCNRFSQKFFMEKI